MIFFFFYAVYALGKRKLFRRHLLARTIFRAVCCVTAEGEKCSLAELSIMGCPSRMFSTILSQLLTVHYFMHECSVP